MMTPPPTGGSPRLERAIGSGRVVVFALATSVLVYLIVGTLVIQSGGFRSDTGTVRAGLVTLGFFALVGSVTWRRMNLSPLKLEVVYGAKGEAGFVDHLWKTMLVSAALGEAVGIAGLATGILTGDTRAMNVFCVISLAAILLSLPRANGWRDAYNQIVDRGRAGAAAQGAPAP